MQLDHVALLRELAIAAEPEGRQIMFVSGKARTAGARGHVKSQEQDRQVNRDDDDHRERHRPGDFMSGMPHGFERRFLAVLLFQPMHGILHHHHRAIHDHSEIDRAQAHQVRADAEQPHPQEADQHGERNDGRGDQSRPQIAEKQQQHDGDQQEPSNRFFSTVWMVPSMTNA